MSAPFQYGATPSPVSPRFESSRWRPTLDTWRARRYVFGMTKKIAISLPDETLRKARAAVKAGKAPKLSNYIALLIEDASGRETFDEMIAAWVQESGATLEEIGAAEEESRKAFERAGLGRKGARGEAASRKAG